MRFTADTSQVSLVLNIYSFSNRYQKNMIMSDNVLPLLVLFSFKYRLVWAVIAYLYICDNNQIELYIELVICLIHGVFFLILGKVITAAYVPLPNYHQLFPDGLRATQLLLPSTQNLNPGLGLAAAPQAAMMFPM